MKLTARFWRDASHHALITVIIFSLTCAGIGSVTDGAFDNPLDLLFPLLIVSALFAAFIVME